MISGDQDTITLAHGIGGAKDLPISPELAIAGAVAALVVSFTVLAVAWRSPRYDATTSGRPAPPWLARVVDSTAFRAAARAFGLVVAIPCLVGFYVLNNRGEFIIDQLEEKALTLFNTLSSLKSEKGLQC